MAAGVELRGVTKTYGAVRALTGVTVAFEPAKVTVVAGANGSGKSTLLGIVGTLTRPTAGTVDHGALGKTRAEVRRKLGWLGHDSLCYPDLSGRENLELAARLYGIDAREAVERARARFDLGAFVERPFRTYSRGQRQRVALARALVQSPQLLLLDEPTTGLDAASLDRLETVVGEEAARGVTVVVVTHDEAFGRAVGSKTITLERGRVVG